MKRVCALLTLSLLAGGFASLRGDDFRVEWLSGRSISALKFEAGTNMLRLCSITQPKRCVVLQPGGTATCVRSGSAIRCNSSGAMQQFQNFSAASPSLFHLESVFSKSRKNELGRSGQVRMAKIRITPTGLRVVVIVDLETYVAGVLAGEVAILKSPPALQAMAVVARTWALRSRGRHRREGFDFCSLTHCQVFGLLSESEVRSPNSISRAVLETRGKVLKYRNQLIDAYFSADCGGETEAAGNIWPDRAAPYLATLRDPYCPGSEHSSWQQTLSLDALSAILRRAMGVSLRGSLLDLKVEDRNDSGRARTLFLEGGSPQRIDANEFRCAVNRRLGWNTLKSNLYTLERRGDSLVFVGRGLGHGVGLCQAGAEQMGRRGIAGEDILSTYFPGTTVSDFPPAASQDPILSSEHFALVFPDGQQTWVNETLHTLETIRAELESRVGTLPAKVRVETFETTVGFIRASKQPGWAAASTDGVSILLQPLSTLNRKGILTSALRHELFHLAIHRLRSPKVTRWFEEGLVLYLTGERVAADARSNVSSRTLEESVSKPHSETEMKAAYALALDRVHNLARERGDSALWQILKNPSDADIHRLGNEK